MCRIDSIDLFINDVIYFFLDNLFIDLFQHIKLVLFNQSIDDKNSPKQTATKKDAFEKLKKLSELKNLGIISDEEYETQRKKFLAEM